MSLKIALLHMGPISYLIPATSIMKKIKNVCDASDTDMHFIWIVKEENLYFFEHHKDVYRVFSFNQFAEEKGWYDVLINLWPEIPDPFNINADVVDFLGFNFCSELDPLKDSVLSYDKHYNMNIFQLYFKLCQLKWRGEGYNINYYPQSREKKNLVGISVANSNLRNYVLENLDLEKMKIWYIPYKKNVFKRMDEINKCKRIVTDDFTTFHLSMALNKYVYYLKTSPLTMEIEMFGKGQIHNVPITVFQ